MTPRGFTTIALPDKITDKIDKLVNESNGLYQSRSHIVKLALYDFFEKNNGGEKKDGSTNHN